MTETATKSRPILFSAPMVRAILEGRKTQTRRVVKPPAPYDSGDDAVPIMWAMGEITCPYGTTGDELWVREKLDLDEDGWVYASDGAPIVGDINNHAVLDWLETRPAKLSHCVSIHMPRWASRITLTITNVRVERLNEISEVDAIAEGCQCAGVPASMTNRGAFAKLWESINGAGSWQANPWVWVVEFQRKEGT